MQVRLSSPGVFYPDEPLVQLCGDFVTTLEATARDAPLGRARLCAHRSSGASVHEMIIVMQRGTYVRPHRHQGKSESFHVIAGRASVLLFSETGNVEQMIPLGDYASGLCFYCRLDEPVFHSVVVTSDTFIMHETTNGPFDRAQTEFASWSPPDQDPQMIEYQQQLYLESTITSPASNSTT